MRRRTTRTLTMMVLSAVSLFFVWEVISADSGDPPARLATEGEFREGPLEGDVSVLEEAQAKSGNWTEFKGTLIQQRSEGSPLKLEIKIWNNGYYYTGDGSLYEAAIDRVMVTSLATDSLQINDHRFKACEPPTEFPQGRTFEFGGAPAFEPKPGEFNHFTNHQMINTLVAPAYWMRTELERLGTSVEDLGREEIAGRSARKFRVLLQPPGGNEDGSAQVAETLWVDDERGVVLRRIREGEQRQDPRHDDMEEFRQEWRFEQVIFDDPDTSLKLSELSIPNDHSTVRYVAWLPSKDTFVERDVEIAGDATAESIVAEMTAAVTSDQPRRSCDK